jgi:hypothetical protein
MTYSHSKIKSLFLHKPLLLYQKLHKIKHKILNKVSKIKININAQFQDNCLNLLDNKRFRIKINL